MICDHCGNFIPDGSAVCPQCGKALVSRPRETGAAARRQGRPDRPSGVRLGSYMPDVDNPPSAASEPFARPHRMGSEGMRPVSMNTGMQPRQIGSRDSGRDQRFSRRPNRRRMINWALLWTILLAVLVVAAIGTFGFLKFTDAGQLIMARMGRDANATAMWKYGQELLDQGYLDRSVAALEKAYELDPDREDIYDRLFQLADTYEAAGRLNDAESVYVKLYTDIAPDDPEVYRQVMRLMESQERRMELAALLKLAYEKTNDSYFKRERDRLLPATPTASKEAGPIKYEQDIHLLSDDTYDIYYILGDEGELPEDGTLYVDTQPIHLGEGAHVLRAVAVSSDLISDEMRISYSISLPRPAAPYASLAPGVYEKRQRIWLKLIKTEDQELLEQKRLRTDQEEEILRKLNDITIYYTLDSQTPTSNSPIYTGEPFLLPLGPSMVKAIAVNGFGKASNVMERTYNIKKPFKLYFSDSDNFNDFVIMVTEKDAFIRKFGTPATETEIEDENMEGSCLLMKYSWGEARFFMTDKGYVIYAFESNSPNIVGPEKTKMGMSETDVTSLFRDMGMEHNQDGSRSLYYDKQNRKYAMMYHLSATNDRIDYSYVRQDNLVVTLSYHLQDHRVVKMSIHTSLVNQWGT
ncbi:MAG: chitobiase/beta-hexosaminidase C-terminal domain-containing protein [Clostridia bacterium]|nr:chitobiase/beta-hexosaminidase C-terminal domain-containing protein [Clostridia bacterium]